LRIIKTKEDEKSALVLSLHVYAYYAQTSFQCALLLEISKRLISEGTKLQVKQQTKAQINYNTTTSKRGKQHLRT